MRGAEFACGAEDSGEQTAEAHLEDCPVCSDQAPSEVIRMRALLRSCMPACCPPTLRARIVREVRFVALTFQEINEDSENGESRQA